MTMVANFTPDSIKWMHVGVDGIINPGEIKEFDTNRANFILNKFGPRGLVELKFGDNPEDKKRLSMEQWKRFWIHNITMYNQDNERRAQSNKEYTAPTKDLVEHAETLGIKLKGPWTNAPTENSELQVLKSENAELKSSVASLISQVKSLMSAVQGVVQSGAVPAEVLTPEQRMAADVAVMGAEKASEPVVEDYLAEHKDKRNKYIRLSPEQFAGWIIENVEMVQQWPSPVIEDMQRKWHKFYPDQPWPLPA